jgi:hypothetical protein
MARLFVVPILLALLPEGVLAFAMVAGIVWLGNVVYGFILMFGAALLMALPLIGDLVIDVNAPPQQVAVKIGWWGRFAYREGEPAELRIRLLGIPYRRRIMRRPRPPKRAKPKVDLKMWAFANKINLSRLCLAGLQAGNESFWGSKTIAVTASGPTQIDVIDQIISGVIGHRMVGPIDIEAKPEGERAVHVTYRIGLAAAFFVGLFVVLQGRPAALARSFRQAQKRAEATRVEVAGPRLVAPAAGGERRPRPRPPEEEREERRRAA